MAIFNGSRQLTCEDSDSLCVNAIRVGFQNIKHALFNEFEDEI